MDTRKTNATSRYRCNWMGCPETFDKSSLLRVHLDGVHLESNQFNTDCRVPGGRWEDWRRAHDPNYSVATDSLVAALPSAAYYQDTPQTRISFNDALPQRRDTTPSTSHASPVRLVTPEQRTPFQHFKATFASFSALDTPIQAVRLNGVVEDSPALSVLVRRSNGSSLPVTPQLHTPSSSSASDESPRKRRRLSPPSPTPEDMRVQRSPLAYQSFSQASQVANGEGSDDSFPEFLPSSGPEENRQQQSSPVHQSSYQEGQDDDFEESFPEFVSSPAPKEKHQQPSSPVHRLPYQEGQDATDKDSGDSFPDFLPSDDRAISVRTAPAAGAPLGIAAFDVSQASSAAVEHQLTQPPDTDVVSRSRSPEEQNPLDIPLIAQTAAELDTLHPLDDSLTEPETQSQNNQLSHQITSQRGPTSASIAEPTSIIPVRPEKTEGDNDNIAHTDLSLPQFPPSRLEQSSQPESSSHPETLASVQQHQVESYLEELEKERGGQNPEASIVPFHPPPPPESQGLRRSSRLRSTSVASAGAGAKAPPPKSRTQTRSRSRSEPVSKKGSRDKSRVKQTHETKMVAAVETIVEEGETDEAPGNNMGEEEGLSQIGSASGQGAATDSRPLPTSKPKVPIPRMNGIMRRTLQHSPSRPSALRPQPQPQPQLQHQFQLPTNPLSHPDQDVIHLQLRSQPPSPSSPTCSHSQQRPSESPPPPHVPLPSLEERLSRIVAPLHFDLMTSTDKNDSDEDKGSLSQLQLLTQAPYNYSSQSQSHS